jgi:PAS domain S-box-containing protein
MSVILIITISFHFVATFWSAVLLYQFRVWGMLLLTFMCALMTYRQFAMLSKGFHEGEFLSFNVNASAIIELLISLLLLLFVNSWRKVINEYLVSDEKIKSSQRLLQSVLNTIPVRVFWKDKQSVFLGCNSLFAQDAGLESEEDLIGKNDNDFSWKDQAEFYRADDREVMHSDQAKINYEEPQVSPTGDEHWLRTSKIPLKNTQGEIIGVLGTYEDITQRKIEGKAAQFTKFAVDNLDIAAFWVKYTGEIVYVNNAACKLLGYDNEELLNMHVWDFDPSPRFSKENWDDYWSSTRVNYTATFETTQKNKNGEVIPVEITTNHLQYEGEEYRCTFVRDLRD